MSSITVCTQNENNVFEVSWKNDSNWFTKLFQIQTEFTFVTGQLGSDWRDRSHLNMDWCDPEGKPATDNDIHNINIKLQEMKMSEIYHGWVGKGEPL